jgi:hypothetical protein
MGKDHFWIARIHKSSNLMIKPAPGDWVGPLEAITMRKGDCKSYSLGTEGGGADSLRLRCA